MLPHAELDNYKLQVELLQEKLKRSEENREKLEHKLENAMHRKTEQEKIVRAKQRQKYQEFVSDLEKRNERNRQLKQMLERIDQQTTALSARSERLRMMKMQYEMYFAKLVQSQTMRCIQGTTSNITTTPTPIPVLLPATPPTQQSSIITATPIKNNEHDPTTSKAKAAAAAAAAAATSSAIYQCDASGNLIAAGTVPKPVSYTLSPSSHIVQEIPSCNTIIPSSAVAAAVTAAATPLPALTAGTQHWTLAMTTPTPTGMLLTTTPTMGVIPTTAAASAAAAAAASADFVSVPAYDYMQYPFGYLPRMRHLLQPKPNTPIYSDESDDLLQPMDANTKSDRYCRTNKENDRDNLYPTMNENNTRMGNDIGSLSQMDLPTRQFDNDKGIGVGGGGWIGGVTTPGTTEILRKNNENGSQQGERQKPEHLLSNVSTTSSASSLTLDKLPKTMTMTEHATAAAAAAAALTPIDERNNDADDGGKPQLATCFDETSKGISIIGYDDKGASMPTQRSVEEKSLPKATTDDSAGTIPSTVISNDNGNAIEEDLRRKIDNMMPAPQQQHMTQSWHKTESVVNRTETMAGTPGTPGNKDNASNNADVTGGFTESAQNRMTNNGLNSVSDMAPTTTKMSIEKIESEIYGELVNPPTGETDMNDARDAAQGLVNELVTQQQPQQQQLGNEQMYPGMQGDATMEYANYGESEQQNAALTYEQSNSESYDPTYATIEGTTTAEVYQQPGTELAYTDDPNASNNYAQYTADPNAMQSQQDYSNLDYANYDATQYSETGAYDPNAYPGYTYDAATGQYTPDPTQQYTNEDGTVAYDAQGVYDQQQYDAPPENQDYDYANYTQETDNVNAAYADTTAAPEQADNQAATAPANLESTAAPAIPAATTNSKPTSILSSAEKHAAANDAQKKKKRVNFVDSSETDDSSSVKQGGPNTGAGSESDFDFSSSEKSEKSGGNGNEGI